MRSLISGPVMVRSPASSANVGPGFDSLGLALSLADETTGEVVASGLEIEIIGEGETGLIRDERHLSVRAMRSTFDILGSQPGGLRLRCRNAIPHARGLGSSAAAIVTGVLAARALVANGGELLDDAAVLELAARLEGHPDNVAACLLGGLTIAWRDNGTARAVRCPPLREDGVLLFVSRQRSSTAAARALLPATVSHADAAASVGRAALLVHALTADWNLLLPATRDWLHQGVRAVAMPESAALLRTLRSAGVPAVLSGAGPSVLALTGDERAAQLPGHAVFQVYRLHIDKAGATVTRTPTAARPR